jgi:hypothetical protein
MASNTQEKEVKEPLNYRIEESYVKRIEALGKRSTVAAGIVKQFITVRELTKDHKNASDIIKGTDGSVVYGRHFRDGLYHVTTKSNGSLITIEVDREALAQHIVNMVDILNSTTNTNEL